MVQKFFLEQHDISYLNHTNIALIPKNHHSLKPKDFHPVSLCNTPYKIISKILANRLKLVLHKFIFSLQGAFVKNRQISENTIIAHEIIHSIRTRKRKILPMAIKLDMSKAFD